MPLRKLIAVLLVLLPGFCFGKSDGITESRSALTVREHRVWTQSKRETEFAAIGHTAARNACEATRPPAVGGGYGAGG